MKTRHSGDIVTFDDSWNLGKPNLIVAGQFALAGVDNYDVCIYPDVKSGHASQSPHPLDDHPSTYWILPHVVAQGQHYPSSSQNPAHLARLPYGHTEVYQVDNIYKLLDNPDWISGYASYSMVVPVFYPYDGRPNKALTFYVVPNPMGRRLG